MEKNGIAKIISYWLPAIAWMIVIFILSSRPSVSVSVEYWYNFLFFKSLHVIEYAMLFFLFIRAFKNTTRIKNYYWYAFVIVVMYAFSDEFHQTLVPTREGRLRDVIIDAIGAGLSWIYLQKLVPKAHKRLRILAKKLGVY